VLTPENYQLAWLIYLSAGACTLLYLRYIWRGSMPSMVLLLLVLSLAALLLTPARPESGADTYAPALVVAAFDLLTYGPEAVSRALRPIGFTLSVALALGAIIGLVQALLRRRKS
jgi:hypothetical protein